MVSLAADIPAAGRRAPARLGEVLAAWSLAGPATLLLILLLLGPTVAVVALSFTDWLFGAASLSFIGFENYREMSADRVFWISLGNTLLYVGFVVPVSVLLGLGAALLIEAGSSGRAVYRAIYFLPVTSTLLAMALVWEFAFHPTVGVINQALQAIGLAGRDWLRDRESALFALGAIGVWQALGLNMVLFMAGLKAIPRDLYDAAAVDGADGPWERFRRVTWPMLGPATVFVVTITAIRSFQVFDTVAVLTQGGPDKATEVLLYTMVTEGFSFFRSGYASALTVVFLVFVLALTLLQVRLLEKRVHYT